jgi:hypothetical protein
MAEAGAKAAERQTAREDQPPLRLTRPVWGHLFPVSILRRGRGVAPGQNSEMARALSTTTQVQRAVTITIANARNRRWRRRR